MKQLLVIPLLVLLEFVECGDNNEEQYKTIKNVLLNDFISKLRTLEKNGTKFTEEEAHEVERNILLSVFSNYSQILQPIVKADKVGRLVNDILNSDEVQHTFHALIRREIATRAEDTIEDDLRTIGDKLSRDKGQEDNATIVNISIVYGLETPSENLKKENLIDPLKKDLNKDSPKISDFESLERSNEHSLKLFPENTTISSEEVSEWASTRGLWKSIVNIIRKKIREGNQSDTLLREEKPESFENSSQELDPISGSRENKTQISDKDMDRDKFVELQESSKGSPKEDIHTNKSNTPSSVPFSDESEVKLSTPINVSRVDLPEIANTSNGTLSDEEKLGNVNIRIVFGEDLLESANTSSSVPSIEKNKVKIPTSNNNITFEGLSGNTNTSSGASSSEENKIILSNYINDISSVNNSKAANTPDGVSSSGENKIYEPLLEKLIHDVATKMESVAKNKTTFSEEEAHKMQRDILMKTFSNYRLLLRPIVEKGEIGRLVDDVLTSSRVQGAYQRLKKQQTS